MKYLIIVFCLFATSGLAFGQICDEYPCVIGSSDTGETASAAIDQLLVHASESNERIFVIARLGVKETNSSRNFNRLCAARNYMLNRLLDSRFKVYFDSLPPVFGEGITIKGEGQLEFYLGSKLALIRVVKRNKSANLSCCGELTSFDIKQNRKKCKEWKEKVLSKKIYNLNDKN